MVLNGTTNITHNGTTNDSKNDKNSSFTSSNNASTISNGKNIYQLNNDYSISNGTGTRRSIVNGTSPYKNNSTRLIQQTNGKILNGSTNGSPRSSVASFTSSSYNGTSNGYENGSPRGRQSPCRQHVSQNFFQLQNHDLTFIF